MEVPGAAKVSPCNCSRSVAQTLVCETSTQCYIRLQREIRTSCSGLALLISRLPILETRGLDSLFSPNTVHTGLRLVSNEGRNSACLARHYMVVMGWDILVLKQV